MTKLNLAFDMQFKDLYNHSGLVRLDGAFVKELAKSNVDLHNKFVEARTNPDALENKAESELIIELAPHVEDFIGKLFGIRKDIHALAAKHDELANIYTCKRLFVQRQAAKAYKPEIAETFDGVEFAKILEQWFGEVLTERSYADNVNAWLENKEANSDKI